jgi:hypothetical protein
LEGVVGREESSSSGVYFLTGNDPESGKPALYIGEAENIRDRIKAHLEKDFWNQIVFFISKDENLTKAHIRYLEGKLIEKARQVNRALVMNGQGSGSKLPESDREDMKVFLEKVYQLLPVLGVELLVSASGKALTDTEKGMLYCEIKGLEARGRLTPSGFLIMKGSKAVLKDRASSKKYPWPLNMRKKLKEEGIIVIDEEFSSPSAAAAVIHGGHANGLTAWKNREGKTLKEIETT